MNPEQTQAPSTGQEMPQEADQDTMIIQFLQELESRIEALEAKVLNEEPVETE